MDISEVSRNSEDAVAHGVGLIVDTVARIGADIEALEQDQCVGALVEQARVAARSFLAGRGLPVEQIAVRSEAIWDSLKAELVRAPATEAAPPPELPPDQDAQP